jgi:hypothetical protein
LGTRPGHARLINFSCSDSYIDPDGVGGRGFKRPVLGLSRSRGLIKENQCLYIRAASIEGVVEPNKSFLLRIQIWSPKFQNEISCIALVDTGASAQIFIDISFAHSQRLFTQKLQKPRALQLADGSPAPSGVHEKAILDFKLLEHTERASGFLTKLNPAVPIILGLEWLRLHDPSISWAKNTVTFNSHFCRHHCLKGGHPITVTGLTKEGEQTRQPALAQIHATEPLPEKRTEDRLNRSNPGKIALDAPMSGDKEQPPSPGTVPGTLPSQGNKKIKTPRLPAKVVGGVRLPHRAQNQHPSLLPVKNFSNPEKQEELESLDIRFIGAAPFAHLARRKRNQISRVDLRHSVFTKPHLSGTYSR